MPPPGQFPPGQNPYGPGPGPGAAPGQAPHRPGGPANGAPGPRASFEYAGPVIRQRDSALPEDQPSAGTGPIAAIETDNIAAFARDLRVLRNKAGLDYPEMAEKSHYTMRTLASAAGGMRMPTLPVLIAYVTACGGDQAEWEERWGKLMKAREGQPSLTASDTDAMKAVDDEMASGSGSSGTADSGKPKGTETTSDDRVYVITTAPARDNRW